MSLENEINFSFNLLSLLHDDSTKGSIIFSPKSILTGLAMIFPGAKDETAKQIQEIIGKGKNDQEILDFYSMFMKQQNNKKDSSGIKITLANQIFVADKLALLPKFCEIIENNFDVKIEKMDFNTANETSTKINEIINQKTSGQINNITKPSDITPDLAVLLINAMHFSAKWKDILSPKKATFYSSDSTQREIDMLYRRVMEDRQWNYIKSDECCVLGIPYENNEAWMYIVLPNERNGLQKIVKNLNAENFNQWTKRSPNPYTVVHIPAMVLSNEFDLKKNLQKLGIKDAFENTGNLKGMVKQPSKLKKIIHKAVIKTDEYGTEASAWTSVYDSMCCGCTEEFIAEHPFLFFITTNDPGDLKPLNILFIGTFC